MTSSDFTQGSVLPSESLELRSPIHKDIIHGILVYPISDLVHRENVFLDDGVFLGLDMDVFGVSAKRRRHNLTESARTSIDPGLGTSILTFLKYCAQSKAAPWIGV